MSTWQNDISDFPNGIFWRLEETIHLINLTKHQNYQELWTL